MNAGNLYVNADYINSGIIRGIDIYGTNITGSSTITGVIQLTSTIGSIVIEVGQYSSTQLRGKVDFSDASVTGLNVVARFG